LTLARALAGGPRLLVLDDATSAVDPRVEAAILAGLRGRPGVARAGGAAGAAGASILVVAYRRATIALADQVVYLERGRVVARGRHAELLDSTPGYAALVTAYERADEEREREHSYDEDLTPAADDEHRRCVDCEREATGDYPVDRAPVHREPIEVQEREPFYDEEALTR
jgi:ATP-binding cassette, subfamily B, bacterial